MKTASNVNASTLTPSEFRQWKVICAAFWCFYHAPQINYSNVRGKGLTDQFRIPPYVPEAFDCSGFATYCYSIAGCPDPNGGNYRTGPLDTSSLWRNGFLVGGPNVKQSDMEPGDLIFFSHDQTGPMQGGNSEHVSIYIDTGSNVSMGNNDGPSIYKYVDETKPVRGVRRYTF